VVESRNPQAPFVLKWNDGGITSLKLLDDVFDTDYIWQGETLGEVVVRYWPDERDWREATAFSSGDIRQVHISGEDDPEALTFSYEGDSLGAHGIRDFRLTVQFGRREDSLVWTLRFRNHTDQALELGDIALPLPFNRQLCKTIWRTTPGSWPGTASSQATGRSPSGSAPTASAPISS
jgi:hypothetical protein